MSSRAAFWFGQALNGGENSTTARLSSRFFFCFPDNVVVPERQNGFHRCYRFPMGSDSAMSSFNPSSACEETTGDIPPGGVYLCQVSASVSCGACCGLYNRFRWSRKEISDALARRTRLFAEVPREVAAIDAFRRRIESQEPRRHPLPQFHHCPFLGLVGRRRSRVGCLLHPMAEGNHGVDYRGLSEYGGLACRTYFCPTHRRVRPAHSQIVRNAIPHWYDYGFVVTEWKFLVHLFTELEKRCQRPLLWADIADSASCRQSLVDLLLLKMSWPYRSSSKIPPVHYFFNDRMYVRPGIDYSVLGTDVSPLDAILAELDSDFATAQQLREAEAVVNRLLSVFQRRYDAVFTAGDGG